MYLVTVRLRNFPSNDSMQEFSRHLIDHFSHEAEMRMDLMHGLSSRGIRVKYLKDLFLQWRGVLAAYDEGLIKGDAVLGAAVWRNLFKGAATGPDGRELDWSQVARIVAYMRRVLVDLASVDDASIVSAVSGGQGQDTKRGIFARNQLDQQLVKRNSDGLSEPFRT
jgi:cytochrome b pre-mRNA-processing protein 3